MKIPPYFTITPEMVELLSRIDAYRLFFSSHPSPQILKEKIRRVSVLKSSLFSARIEGNPLRLDTLETTDEVNQKKEVFNILSAITFIDTTIKPSQNVTKQLLKHIHSHVLQSISPDAGKIRTEISAIFNQAGVAVYMPPPPLQISPFLDSLLKYINSDEEKFPLITAIIAHLIFEKIHPFLDGNGRVGRLLMYAVMKVKSYDMGFYIPFEEYLDSHKDEYYFHLDQGVQNTEGYIMFMLHAFLEQIGDTKRLLEMEMQKKETLLLPPRQEEIYNLIQDHSTLSFDSIRRRFLKVPERTLRYDLKKLQDEGYVIKIGKTKGSWYKINNQRHPELVSGSITGDAETSSA
jgi:Fic family protein